MSVKRVHIKTPWMLCKAKLVGSIYGTPIAHFVALLRC